MILNDWDRGDVWDVWSERLVYLETWELYENEVNVLGLEELRTYKEFPYICPAQNYVFLLTSSRFRYWKTFY